ncbi:MAG: YitT family protein [Anaerovoracaceae bacterium]
MKNDTVSDIIKHSVMAAMGLMLFGFGVHLTIQANIGVAPWDTLNLGLSKTFGILYGTASVAVSFTIIAIDLMLRERIGIGTVLDAIVVGKTVDLLNWIGIVPAIEGNLPVSIAVMLIGLFIMGLAQVIYMKAGLCCGPRDALMLAINRRLKKLPVGAVNVLMMVVVLFAGWRLGGPIGIGTIICTFGIGALMQLAFAITRFEPKDVEHTGFVECWRMIKSGIIKKQDK